MDRGERESKHPEWQKLLLLLLVKLKSKKAKQRKPKLSPVLLSLSRHSFPLTKLFGEFFLSDSSSSTESADDSVGSQLNTQQYVHISCLSARFAEWRAPCVGKSAKTKTAICDALSFHMRSLSYARFLKSCISGTLNVAGNWKLCDCSAFSSLQQQQQQISQFASEESRGSRRRVRRTSYTPSSSSSFD